MRPPEYMKINKQRARQIRRVKEELREWRNRRRIQGEEMQGEDVVLNQAFLRRYTEGLERRLKILGTLGTDEKIVDSSVKKLELGSLRNYFCIALNHVYK